MLLKIGAQIGLQMLLLIKMIGLHWLKPQAMLLKHWCTNWCTNVAAVDEYNWFVLVIFSGQGYSNIE